MPPQLDKTMKHRKERRTNPTLVWIGIIVFVGFLFTHWRIHRVNVPHELVGTWTTTAPQYSNRTFEIDVKTVDFGMGKAGTSTGFITDIRSTRDGSGTLYTIWYRLDGSSNQVSFHYNEKGDHTIRFLHQEQIAWVKG